MSSPHNYCINIILNMSSPHNNCINIILSIQLPSESDNIFFVLFIIWLVTLFIGVYAICLGILDVNGKTLNSEQSVQLTPCKIASVCTLNLISKRMSPKNVGKPISKIVKKIFRFCIKKFFHSSNVNWFHFPILFFYRYA